MDDRQMAGSTVGHEQSSPLFQSVAERTLATSRIIRAQRQRDLVAAIAEFWRASGPDRTWWRRDASHRLAEWRRLYRQPEHAAFRQAIIRSRA